MASRGCQRGRVRFTIYVKCTWLSWTLGGWRTAAATTTLLQKRDKKGTFKETRRNAAAAAVDEDCEKYEACYLLWRLLSLCIFYKTERCFPIPFPTPSPNNEGNSAWNLCNSRPHKWTYTRQPTAARQRSLFGIRAWPGCLFDSLTDCDGVSRRWRDEHEENKSITINLKITKWTWSLFEIREINLILD